MLRIALMAANTLLRPQARQRFGVYAILLLLSAIFCILAFGFGLSGFYMLLAEEFGPPIGALLTAATLLFLAICLLIGLVVHKKRTPPPPMIDPSSIAMLGLAAGLVGLEAYSTLKQSKDS